MSQAKVDKYKQEKANRKKSMRKEKVKRMIRRTAVGVLSLALIGWLGYSAYNIYDSNKEKESVEINYSAITDYQSGLSSTDSAE